MTFGSLFAGIGGIDLGLERAGMVCKWQVEIDDFCQKVLAKHWPSVPRFADVRDCGMHNLEPVDLVAGGFPCQDVSTAGKRKGLRGEQSGLWSEFARIICELKPRWVLVENVPGLLSSNAGRDFGTVLGDLAAGGYDAEWDCIPAAAFGAPHLRYRVFVVAYAKSGGVSRQGESDENTRMGPASSSQGFLGVPPVPIVAHAKSAGTATAQQSRQLCQSEQGREDMAHAACFNGAWAISGGNRSRKSEETAGNGSCDERPNWWAIEPRICRVAHGIPHRVDRLRALGNAVVPQVAEWLGHQIIKANQECGSYESQE